MNKQTILFDFDGVIADSFEAALSTAKTRCMHKTEEVYRRLFEGNIYEGKDDATLDHSQCNHNIDWWDTLASYFNEEDALFAQMDDVVKQLAAEHRLVIVSSSMHAVISSFLKTHGLDQYFTAIYDADVHRSKSEKIGMIFEKYGIGPDECVMITDSKGDILEAREKGVESIAVTWGFNSYDVLLSGEPFRIVRLPDELPNAVTDFFRGKATSA